MKKTRYSPEKTQKFCPKTQPIGGQVPPITSLKVPKKTLLYRQLIYTVCGYKFNHLVAKLTTLTVSRSASFRGQPWRLEERLKNKKCSQVMNQVPCFWNFELSFIIWILWGFKDGHIKKNCSFWWISQHFTYNLPFF